MGVLGVLFVSALTLGPASILAQHRVVDIESLRDITPDVATHDNPQLAIEDIANLLREVGVRRRVNTLFPNPQSLFDGFQVGFVNVGTGNLSFRRRDLVVWGREPVRFSRVYDSRIIENPDFGPGWRMSLISELHRSGNGLVLVDASGARHRFLPDSDGGYVGALPQYADVRIAIAGSTAHWLRSGKLEHVFRVLPGGDRFTIVSQSTVGGALFHFDYRDGLLRELRRNGDLAIEIERDELGRVTSATDILGRKVAYSYDATGRLDTVRDVAGNDWAYAYDDYGRLTAAISPTDKLVLSAAYDDEGKVVESHSGRSFFYAYSSRKT